MKPLRVLFIGNSHTYYNDLPRLFREHAAEAGYACSVIMLARPCLFLDEHLASPDVCFDIRYGDFDYVVLQEHSHPFDPHRFTEAVRSLCDLIRSAGAVPVLYMTWALKSSPQDQPALSDAFRSSAKETGSLLAPVGDSLDRFRDLYPGISFYGEDGAHPSPEGSRFAASVLWNTISRDLFHT